jgi:hypothetical protein
MERASVLLNTPHRSMERQWRRKPQLEQTRAERHPRSDTLSGLAGTPTGVERWQIDIIE